MNRNAKALHQKAKQCKVEELRGRGWHEVVSPSGRAYHVHRAPDGTCTCDCAWGQRGGYRSRGVSGCSHTVAVQMHVDRHYRSRRTYTHDGQEAARRQRQPRQAMGQDLWITSRIAH